MVYEKCVQNFGWGKNKVGRHRNIWSTISKWLLKEKGMVKWKVEVDCAVRRQE
jgi:hypothetical protein